MDENRPSYSLKAPGASTSSSPMRLPARESFPPVDSHLDPPEVTRWERIGGRRLEALPAKADHAMHHMDLDYVVRAKVAPGYRGAADLKTRFDEESDFASDTAILREGIDPATGRRFLEEIVFEVVSKQNLKVVTEKAPRMIRRGVRRVFAIFLSKGTVCEWSPAEGKWVELDRASVIEDRCLIAPIPVESLFDAAAAHDSVAASLVAMGNPVIQKQRAEGLAEGKARGLAEGKAQGLAEGQAQALLKVLEARGLPPSASLRQRILATTDLDQLERWLTQAVFVTSVEELE